MLIPRVAAVHDLSGFGRCSLTVAIPILSAMGVQCCPLPTAFLSTHTGDFEGYTFLDLTDEMEKAAAHWKTLDLKFQAIYSGFLGSEHQIEVVERFIQDFRDKDTLIVVDPVMGDGGKVYKTYTPAMCEGMKRLSQAADVITPNLTEAALLLDIPYCEMPHDEAGLRSIVEKLSMEGKRSVVLTGYSSAPHLTGALCYDAVKGETSAVQVERVDREFYGTGDVFSSVLTGALVKGNSLQTAAAQAVHFILECAKLTAANQLPLREGVDFEPLLGLLTGV